MVSVMSQIAAFLAYKLRMVLAESHVFLVVILAALSSIRLMVVWYFDVVLLETLCTGTLSLHLYEDV